MVYWFVSTEYLTTTSLLLSLVLLSVKILFGFSPITSVIRSLQLASRVPPRQMGTGRNDQNMSVNEWLFNIKDISPALRMPSSQGHVDTSETSHLSFWCSLRYPAQSRLLDSIFTPLLRIQLVIPYVQWPTLIHVPWALRSVDDDHQMVVSGAATQSNHKKPSRRNLLFSQYFRTKSEVQHEDKYRWETLLQLIDRICTQEFPACVKTVR